jgi:D-amino-acid dehydrogenase
LPAASTATDEQGDAHKFTVELAKLAAARGVRFRHGIHVDSLMADGDAITGARVFDEEDVPEDIVADGYVAALGSYTPLILSGLGIPCNVYPAKGYSATISVGEHQGAPMVSLTDLEWKIVMTRLGDRLRVAGTAELTGWNTDLNRLLRSAARRTFGCFPTLTANVILGGPAPQRCLLIGGRAIALWLDTGHGTLGWTMACGSGKALADVVAGRKPEVSFEFAAP